MLWRFLFLMEILRYYQVLSMTKIDIIKTVIKSMNQKFIYIYIYIYALYVIFVYRGIVILFIVSVSMLKFGN